MNIRYKVYYMTKEEREANLQPTSWKSELPSKLIRAKNSDKAMEIFKNKHPNLVPIVASLY